MTTIRLANVTDAAGILDIYAPIIEQTSISFEMTPPTVAEMGERITTTLKQYPYLVCEHEGRVAGYVYAGAFRKREAYQWSAEVSAYIHADYRGQRMGTALYTALFALLKAQGYYVLFAGATLPNPGSARLHESMGFASVGVYHNTGYKFGAWHDVGWWELQLQPPTDNPTPPTPIGDLPEDVLTLALEAGSNVLPASL